MKRMTYFENGKNRLRFNGVEYSGEFVDRLAAYEDTGLEPKEINDIRKIWDMLHDDKNNKVISVPTLHRLVEAYKDGRCIPIPKVEDTIASIFGWGDKK